MRQKSNKMRQKLAAEVRERDAGGLNSHEEVVLCENEFFPISTLQCFHTVSACSKTVVE